MLKSGLCNYSDDYIITSRTRTINGEGADDDSKQADERDKELVFKSFVPFTDCISQINNAQVDIAKDLDVVMPMYNLTEYSNNYSKTSKTLWQYYTA